MIAYSRQTIAGLNCIVAIPQERPDKPARIAVFCHGYGAPGDDLVPIAEVLLANQADPRLGDLALVFPEAPLEIDSGFEGRAWWPIDMLRLQEIAMTGDVELLAESVPDELSSRRDQLTELIETIRNDWSVPDNMCFLGGFSQGAMLATDVLLHSAAPLGGLIIWSGALINRTQWQVLAERSKPFDVVQSHGFWDPILPFAAGIGLRDLLAAAGHNVNFISFQGYHEIPGSGLEACRRLLTTAKDVREEHN